jgi:hypothetical protein
MAAMAILPAVSVSTWRGYRKSRPVIFNLTDSPGEKLRREMGSMARSRRR